MQQAPADFGIRWTLNLVADFFFLGRSKKKSREFFDDFKEIFVEFQVHSHATVFFYSYRSGCDVMGVIGG